MSLKELYTPLREWQTRLLRLAQDSVIYGYELVTVDLIYFEGAVIRGNTNQSDRVVEYDALSYTWGADTPTVPIVVNGCDTLKPSVRHRQRYSKIGLLAPCAKLARMSHAAETV